MPNKVPGATDFLTIAGVAGSETYQTPNTAPYQTADTDYIWFKTDSSQRTTTTAELIGYDFTRTIVYYGDTAPNAIVAIMILSSNVDTAKMRDDFHLSVWWSNVLSSYGNVKSNRGVGKSVWTPESVHEDEVVTYIAGLTTPLSDGQLTLLDTFVLALKTGLSITNLSDAFDAMYILAGETEESSLKNLVKNAHHCAKVNTPTFTALEGFTGIPVSNSYLDTNYNPSTQAVRLSLNSASIGSYSRTNNNGAYCDIGYVKTTAAITNFYIYPRLTDVFYYPNSCAVNQDVANTDSRGFFISSRTAVNLTTGYRNGNPVDTDATASNTLLSLKITLLGRRRVDTGLADSISINQLSFAFIGRGLSGPEVTVLTNAIEAYMDANSKGVI